MDPFRLADWRGRGGTKSTHERVRDVMSPPTRALDLHLFRRRRRSAGDPAVCNPSNYFIASSLSPEVVVQRSKQILLALGLGVVVAGGGAGLVEATSSSSTAAPATASKTAAVPAGSATVNVTTTKVGGQSEQILVNARGLPLYTYGPDTSTQSHVSGGLAALWPPLVSASPSEAGATGTLSVLPDANGQQVRYNGHFLYTFLDDTPGQVTGQGVQGFFVATPSLSAGSTNAASAAPVTPANADGY
jgi:predicted lipoprotein with Yx(FWY)xxD motif